MHSQEISSVTIRSADRLRDTGFRDTIPPKASRVRFEGLANAYGAVSWIFGFKEKHSLAFCECVDWMGFAAAHLACLQ